ncbi:hypothetical protein OH492_29275 [Vibrio chagasii]|nr:hypothetical protein [Vibrio chagasii]
MFDLPFIAIFVLAIGVLGGWLVLVPIVSLVLYYSLAKRSIRSSSKRSMQSTVAGTNRQNMRLMSCRPSYAFIRSAGFSESIKHQRFQKANLLCLYSDVQSIGSPKSIHIDLLLYRSGLNIGCYGLRNWTYFRTSDDARWLDCINDVDFQSDWPRAGVGCAMRFNSFNEFKLQVTVFC